MERRAIRDSKGGTADCRRLRLLLLATTLAWTLQAVEALGSPPGTDAFDEAFRFASALTVDPGDMAAVQEQSARAVAATRDLARAARLAGGIEGWRRAAVTADLASLHAARGERARARELVAEADALRKTLSGWPEKRVAMHVAEAMARLGDLEAARKLAGEVAGADPRQYMGRGAGIVAVGHATLGQTAEALEILAALDADPDIDIAFWRTWGYIETARLTSDAGRERAFEAAERSATRVPDLRRIESLESLAGALEETGRAERARALAADAGRLASLIPPSMPIKGRLLARVARRQASLGMKSEARESLRLAVAEAPTAPVIDRPGIYGEAAASYAALGDGDSARETLHRALDAAASLENARPRALALAEILAAAGRSGMPIEPAIRERLESLHRGLGPPW